MAGITSYFLHPAGTTGNSSSQKAEPARDTDTVTLEIVIEAVGATPTCTFGLEGSMDGTNWFTARHVPNDSETAASTQVYTTTGRRILFLKTDLGQAYRFYRCTASANTNVTYSTNLYAADKD